jgi:hypothetical protein
MEFLNAARCTFVVYAPQKDACVAHVESLGGTAAQVYTHEQSRAFRNTRDHVVILIDPSGATEAPRWFEPDGPFQWLFGSTRDRAVVASVHQWCCTMKEEDRLCMYACDSRVRRVGLSPAYVPSALRTPSFGERHGERIALAVCGFALVAGAAAVAFAVMFA